MPISLSSVILPEIREYERTLTTVANSYVRPTVGRYLANLEKALQRQAASAAPCTCCARTAGWPRSPPRPRRRCSCSCPARPAASPAALWVARQSGFENLLTFDMGGTSTDVALVQDGRPRIGRETTVGSLNVRASSVDVRTVGAGGGSIAHVPELTKALRVGPQSAGRRAGPGRVRQGRRRADGHRRQRGARLPAAEPGRRRDDAGRRSGPGGGADDRRRDGPCRTPRPRPPASSTSSTRTCSARSGWSRSSRATTRATSRSSRSAAPARCTPTRWPGCSAPGR